MESREHGFPAGLEYIRSVVQRFTPTPPQRWTVAEYGTLVDGLSREDLQAITRVYLSLESRDDIFVLSEWVERNGMDATREWHLFPLFRALERRGIPPFTDRRVEFSPPPVRLNWSTLPPEFEYLKLPAMKYGKAQFVDERSRLLSTCSDADRAELAALATRVLAPGELERIWEWRKLHLREIEQELVQWLIQLLKEFSGKPY